jgi:hypothetical protein
VLDVPSDGRVVRADGANVRLDRLAEALGPEQFVRVRTRDGQKGPTEVDAYREVATPVHKDRRQGPPRPEILLALRHPDDTFSYHFSDDEGAATATLAKVRAMRHSIEEVLETANGDAGTAEYELRPWIGWQHHITLSLRATWLLVKERRRQDDILASRGVVQHGGGVGASREQARAIAAGPRSAAAGLALRAAVA